MSKVFLFTLSIFYIYHLTAAVYAAIINQVDLQVFLEFLVLKITVGIEYTKFSGIVIINDFIKNHEVHLAQVDKIVVFQKISFVASLLSLDARLQWLKSLQLSWWFPHIIDYFEALIDVVVSVEQINDKVQEVSQTHNEHKNSQNLATYRSQM